jgi:hypothetical protein
MALGMLVDINTWSIAPVTGHGTFVFLLVRRMNTWAGAEVVP